MIQRDATIDDAISISQFVTGLAKEHIASSLEPAGVAKLLAGMDPDSTLARIREGWLHLLQFAGNDLVGVVVVRPPTHLYHLFVKTAAQRSGIGRSLFHAADEWTMRQSGSPILTVNSSINATGAYHRLGFETAGPELERDGVRFQPMVRQGQ